MSNIIYDALLRYAPSDRRRTPNGWFAFNSVCCVYNGESRPDTRRRGGIRLTEDNIVVYNCHNCKFKANWRPGSMLSGRMSDLLEWLQVPSDELKKIKFKVWQYNARAEANIEEHHREFTKLEFAEKALPKGAMPFSHWLQPENLTEEFLNVAQYLADRGDAVLSGYDYYWSPEKTSGFNRRVIIPFKWQDKIVGFTARATFPCKTRYYGDTPNNYIFNTESIKPSNRYIILVEGSLDAVAVNGVATLGDKITEDQCNWLNQTGKEIIVLPDREKMGGKLVDVAIQQGWHVSFPRWDRDVKDAAAASKLYGKLYTMWSVIDAKKGNRLEIEVMRKMDLK
jgi:hypothetical protein